MKNRTRTISIIGFILLIIIGGYLIYRDVNDPTKGTAKIKTQGAIGALLLALGACFLYFTLGGPGLFED